MYYYYYGPLPLRLLLSYYHNYHYYISVIIMNSSIVRTQYALNEMIMADRQNERIERPNRLPSTVDVVKPSALGARVEQLFNGIFTRPSGEGYCDCVHSFHSHREGSTRCSSISFPVCLPASSLWRIHSLCPYV